jgi:molybdate transport system ATP-binding protein
MTVTENIGVGILAAKEEKQELISGLIRKFRLEGLERNYPRQLSGGQQQRVALARILAMAPDVILLDEPFSALDIHLRDQMNRELLTTLEDFPGHVIMVSHSRDEIYRFSEEVLIIDQGRIIDQGSRKDVFSKPSCLRAAALTGCKNFSRADRLDNHTIEAVDWGVRIRTNEVLPEKLAFIGYRAHQFVPVWGEKQENCLPFALARKDELPFEQNYYICPSGQERSPYSIAAWFVQRDLWPVLEEKGLPDYLQIREEDILCFES